MGGIVSALYALATRFGGFGLFATSFFDSSFLFIPLGPDLLLVAMVAQKHGMMPYYALMAALGSVSGCAVIDVVSRKEGEKGLERLLSRRQLHSVTKRVKKSAAWALSFASLMPPPFPFTPVVIAASALQYPRKRLLIVVGVTRLTRFIIEGVLGIYFGRQILHAARSRIVDVGIVILVILSLGGSIISIYEWIMKPKNRSRRGK